MSDPKYLSALQDAIRHMHGCASRHVETVPVKEVFRGETVWEGDVEVFNVEGHARARKCYAWGYEEGGEKRYVAVLKVRPVDTALDAVKAFIISKTSNRKNE
jgi:hypothetical protein